MNGTITTILGSRPESGAPERPVECSLVGEDGNAFAIVGRMLRALRRAGASPEYRAAYMRDATSGGYDHLLAVTMEEIEQSGGDVAGDDA